MSVKCSVAKKNIINNIFQRRIYFCLIAVLCLMCAKKSFAVEINPESQESVTHAYINRFYLGVGLGYGSTTWSGLVPPDNKRNEALDLFLPKDSDEGHEVISLFLGYEVTPYFGFEFTYLQHPKSTIYFADESMFAYNHDGRTFMDTHTEALVLQARIMMGLGHLPMRLYSGFGFAGTHRKDEVKDSWVVRPSFGVGVNYVFADHWMAELGVLYVAGDGKSEMDPVEDYFPFLYSGSLKIAYRF